MSNPLKRDRTGCRRPIWNEARRALGTAGLALAGCCTLIGRPSTCNSRLTRSGSKQNWRTLARRFSDELGMKVYTVVGIDDDGRSLIFSCSRQPAPANRPLTTGPPEPRPIPTRRTTHIGSNGRGPRVPLPARGDGEGPSRRAQHVSCTRITLTTRGGKTVMALALNADLNGRLASLIPVDMSPNVEPIEPQ